MFTLHAIPSSSRHGTLHTAHGDIQTPFFLPVATGGAMRGITLNDLHQLGAQILLCNTYHLHLRPGENIVRDAGGLHSFIGWDKPILTDSGGFQVFSLRHRLRIEPHGVHFQSHIDGAPLFLGPEEAMKIQHTLGSDIIMCFDDCPPSTAPRKRLIEAVDRTLRWAKECKEWQKKLSNKNLLFGIVQGGLERDLREKCTEELMAIGFDGYAIGGLAVGESETEMYGVLECITPLLPTAAPRYLMGVGRLSQLKHCIAKGIDMFDCVLPMREARHGTLHLSDGSTIRIIKQEYRDDHSPIDPDSPSPLSRTHTKSYLHHLFHIHERYAETIACMQNMGVILKLFQELRSTR
ncbi:tRNA guanosine(34) transglycosylase Tgt [Candidatus Peregrinibacteria bacterium]|nr:tRNA guanosine(34) transglycosylase Tgt [Candidatus Peregrinibacteria bacterium]